MPLNIPQNSDIFPSFYERAQAAQSNEEEIRRQGLANIFQGMQNDRYGQMTPLEVMIKEKEAAQAKAVNNPASLDLFRQGQEGQWKTQSAAGQFDEAVVRDKISAEVAKYKASVPEAKFKQETVEMENIYRALEIGLPQLEQIPPGMMRNQAAMKLAQQFGLDPKLIGSMAVNGGLNDLEALKKLKAQLGYTLSETTKHRQEMQKEELKSVTNLEQSRIAADASMYGADKRAASDADRLNQDKAHAKQNIENRYVELKRAVHSGKASPEEIAEFDSTAEELAVRQAQKDLQQAMMSGVFATGKVDYNEALKAAVSGYKQVFGQRPGKNTRAENIPQDSNIKDSAIKAWGQYQPDAYEYRIGPSGNIQRRKK